jgi:undecaprenyl-diphosphatase
VLVLAWAAMLLAGGAMRAITWIGSPLLLDVVFAAALVAPPVRRLWRNALFLTLASPGTVLMVHIIKPAVDRARPLGPRLTPADGSSWPSGHASSSAALYGALLLVALGTRATVGRRARRTLEILVAAPLALIGISRVYLGVHCPTDVLAAWLLVAGWLTVLERTVRHTPSALVDARERT